MQDQSQMSWDVIVVGSGAGAMTSAVVAADRGLSVLVIEKSDKFGGTSAISGGGIWIPNNHYYKAKGGRTATRRRCSTSSQRAVARPTRPRCAPTLTMRRR